jgi:K+-sensing histidine kinase KdpD
LRATRFRYVIKWGYWPGHPNAYRERHASHCCLALFDRAVTAILWQVYLTTGSSHRLVYIYLFPVILIAALYNGRLAVFCTAIAMACADYFLQAPPYSFANDNPLEYGDLICFRTFGGHGDQVYPCINTATHKKF